MSHEDIVDSILPERTAAADEVNEGTLAESVDCAEMHNMSEDEDIQVMQEPEPYVHANDGAASADNQQEPAPTTL